MKNTSNASSNNNSCERVVDCDKITVDKNEVNIENPITVARQILNGLVLTLRPEQITTVGPIWKSVFAVCESALADGECNIKKGSVGTAMILSELQYMGIDIPEIPNLSSLLSNKPKQSSDSKMIKCLQNFITNILPKIIDELESIAGSQSKKETICKFKEQIVCLLSIKDIGNKYGTLTDKTKFKDLMSQSVDLVYNEIVSYLKKSEGTVATRFKPLITEQKTQIIDEIYGEVVPIITVMKPFIDSIEKVQLDILKGKTNPTEQDLEDAFNSLIYKLPDQTSVNKDSDMKPNSSRSNNTKSSKTRSRSNNTKSTTQKKSSRDYQKNDENAELLAEIKQKRDELEKALKKLNTAIETLDNNKKKGGKRTVKRRKRHRKTCKRI